MNAIQFTIDQTKLKELRKQKKEPAPEEKVSYLNLLINIAILLVLSYLLLSYLLLSYFKCYYLLLSFYLEDIHIQSLIATIFNLILTCIIRGQKQTNRQTSRQK